MFSPFTMPMPRKYLDIPGCLEIPFPVCQRPARLLGREGEVRLRFS
jgi:hypothetical protein